ncbi:hypothetical protein BD626DRAFT_476891 [Schizophyllum amplum]|uniref:Phosphatidylglycerol/phosphatidylinositol transfer protein n=1 Tax=Schizophyllum amplum TaxID=97359 RepID=A0A550CZQ8_9AGAR|nr:hypothetical protein BD626DRAFT_476891 [Auriculariopsis ampla]
MKFTALFSLLSVAATVTAQNIALSFPTANATVTAGQNTTVQVSFPNSLTSVQHVSLVISLASCGQANECPSSAYETLGTPMYVGGFDPQYHESALPPYQNFSVQIPEGTAEGTNLLTVAHFMLLGASFVPILDFSNATVYATSA